MKQIIFFQILSDETRLRMLALMAGEGELCVCELVHALGVSQPKISRHLAVLRDAGIASSRRRAQWIFHHINPDLPEWQSQVIATAIVGVEDEKIIRQDKKRLKTMKNRPKRSDVA